MKLHVAIIFHIEQPCIEHKMTKYYLSIESGVPQSAFPSIKKRDIITLYSIYEGFKISLKEFSLHHFLVAKILWSNFFFFIFSFFCF